MTIIVSNIQRQRLSLAMSEDPMYIGDKAPDCVLAGTGIPVIHASEEHDEALVMDSEDFKYSLKHLGFYHRDEDGQWIRDRIDYYSDGSEIFSIVTSQANHMIYEVEAELSLDDMDGMVGDVHFYIWGEEVTKDTFVELHWPTKK